MGFLGSIRKRVNNAPLLRMKRKRQAGEHSLKFSSTFTDDSSSVMEDSIACDARRPSLRHLEAVSEDTQELLSPKDGDDVDGFALDPILVSDDDVTDDEQQKNDNHVEEKEETQPCLMQVDTIYVNDDSDYEEVELHQPHVSLIRSHTPPNALLPTHARGRSDGQHHVMHIFHDELATLYEEPNKSSDTLDSVKSSNSIVEHHHDANNHNTSVVRLRDSLDESNIRARWEYALRLMVGNCEPSELLYNTIVEMMPMATIGNCDELDMEMAEI